MPWAVRVRSTNHWTARDVPVKGHACWNLRISPSFVNPAELRKNNDTSICSPPALEIPEGKTLSLFLGVYLLIFVNFASGGLWH